MCRSLTECQSEFGNILETLNTGLESRLIDGDKLHKDNQHLYFEDWIVIPENCIYGCLQGAHIILSSIQLSQNVGASIPICVGALPYLYCTEMAGGFAGFPTWWVLPNTHVVVPMQCPRSATIFPGSPPPPPHRPWRRRGACICSPSGGGGGFRSSFEAGAGFGKWARSPAPKNTHK